MESISERPRGAGVPAVDAADWRDGWVGGGGVHRDYRAVWGTAVSAGCGGVEKVSGSCRRVAGDGIPAVQIFSGCAGKRGAADEGGPLCTRGVHQFFHIAGKIFLYVGDTGERDSAWARRASGAGGRRHRFGAGTGAGVEAGESEGAIARGGCGGGGGGI